MNKRHIIFNGEHGAGKSVLLERLLKSCEKPVYGFFTRLTERDESGFHSIYIYPADSTERPMTKDNHVGDCDGRNRTVNISVFDTLGLEYLQRKPNGIIAMDELGFMETGSEAFCSEVMDCLDGEEHIIATVKARYDVQFLNQIRSHPNVQVFDVTPENREELYCELLPVILEWNNE